MSDEKPKAERPFLVHGWAPNWPIEAVFAKDSDAEGESTEVLSFAMDAEGRAHAIVFDEATGSLVTAGEIAVGGIRYRACQTELPDEPETDPKATAELSERAAAAAREVLPRRTPNFAGPRPGAR